MPCGDISLTRQQSKVVGRLKVGRWESLACETKRVSARERWWIVCDLTQRQRLEVPLDVSFGGGGLSRLVRVDGDEARNLARVDGAVDLM